MTAIARRPERHELLQLLDAALDAIARRNDPTSIAVVAAPIAPELAARLRPAGLRWVSPGDTAISGGPPAIVLDARGPGRFRELEQKAGALWPRVMTHALAGAGAPAPRLYGGFAFCPGSADDEPWRELGDARFVLPSWCAGVAADTAWLSVACPDVGDAHSRLAALDRVETALARASDGPAVRNPVPAAVEDELGRAAWRDHIEAIRSEIRAGRSEKIVAARRCMVELAEPIDPRAVTERLSSRHPSCTVFGFEIGSSVFAGATPERLIARQGARIECAALAGSIGADAHGAAAKTLLCSDKDRREHTLVVREIARRLAPLCAELNVPESPSVRALSDVLHLETPIAGRLARPAHLLELGELLHPTPAVGGAPTEGAVAWIERTEPTKRGWYAGPVGWFDAAGNGELAIALRSGLMRGRRAWIYAGAGIVADSDPDAEYEETRLKQRAMLDALGLSQSAGAT